MPHSPACNEARRAPRLTPKPSTRLEVYRDPDGSGPNLAVRILDISATGAGLLLQDELPIGHTLGLALYGPQLLPIVGSARVVWVKEAADGNFITGVELTLAARPDHLAAVTQG